MGQPQQRFVVQLGDPLAGEVQSLGNGGTGLGNVSLLYFWGWQTSGAGAALTHSIRCTDPTTGNLTRGEFSL